MGLTLSAVLHFLVVSIYPLFLGDFSVPALVGDTTAPEAPIEGTEIVQIVELAEPDEPPDAQPQVNQEEPPTPAAVASDPEDPNTAPVEETSPVDEEEGLTVAERLQPRIIDPRLWLPVNPDYIELTDQERAELLLRGMIQNWNDSMAVAEALSERAMDWTYTDDEGRRWGLSPGRLHLGDFSIPLPFSLALPPGRREALADRQQIRDDLARGAVTAIIRETWAERARAIRERLEAERSANEATIEDDDGSGGRDR